MFIPFCSTMQQNTTKLRWGPNMKPDPSDNSELSVVWDWINVCVCVCDETHVKSSPRVQTKWAPNTLHIERPPHAQVTMTTLQSGDQRMSLTGPVLLWISEKIQKKVVTWHIMRLYCCMNVVGLDLFTICSPRLYRDEFARKDEKGKRERWWCVCALHLATVT